MTNHNRFKLFLLFVALVVALIGGANSQCLLGTASGGAKLSIQQGVLDCSESCTKAGHYEQILVVANENYTFATCNPVFPTTITVFAQNNTSLAYSVAGNSQPTTECSAGSTFFEWKATVTELIKVQVDLNTRCGDLTPPNCTYLTICRSSFVATEEPNPTNDESSNTAAIVAGVLIPVIVLVIIGMVAYYVIKNKDTDHGRDTEKGKKAENIEMKDKKKPAAAAANNDKKKDDPKKKAGNESDSSHSSSSSDKEESSKEGSSSDKKSGSSSGSESGSKKSGSSKSSSRKSGSSSSSSSGSESESKSK